MLRFTHSKKNSRTIVFKKHGGTFHYTLHELIRTMYLENGSSDFEEQEALLITDAHSSWKFHRTKDEDFERTIIFIGWSLSLKTLTYQEFLFADQFM